MVIGGKWAWGITLLTLFQSHLVAANQTQPQLGIRDNTPKLTALTHARIVTEPGEVLENATLVIRDGFITSVEENQAVPAGAMEINLDGFTLYAGFIDPYSQYGLDWHYDKNESSSPRYSLQTTAGRHHNDTVHSEMRWAEHFFPDAAQAEAWYQNGFTTVQTAFLDGVFRGTGAVVSLAQGDSKALIYHPSGHQFTAFDPGTHSLEYPNSTMGAMALIRQTLSDARWYGEQQGKTALEPNPSLAALSGDRFLFSADHPDDLLRSSQLFAEFGLKPTLLGTGLEFERLPQLKATDATLVLPLKRATQPRLDATGDDRDITLQQLRHWERSPGNAAAVAEAGLPFTLTQHGIKADKFWPRLEDAIIRGLGADQALAALTTTPAQLLNIDDLSGRLAPGYRADIVVVRGDLFDGGTIEGLYLQGEYRALDPSHSHHYPGQYPLTLADQSLILSLSLEDDKLAGQLEAGESQIPLFELDPSAERLGFKARLDDLGRSGIAVFSLQRQGEALTGSVLYPNGELAALVAQPLAPLDVEPEDEAEDEAAEADTEPYLSRLTFPNRAYGVSKLPAQQDLHIKNATVWTSADAGILEGTDVLVEDGEIIEIGKQLDTPRGFTVVDATGKHLTAGIIDEHSHIAVYGGVNEASDTITSEVRIGDVVDPNDIHIYRSLAGGVTSAQLLHGSANPIGGQAQVIQLRWGEDAEGLKFDAAPASIKFALGENVKQSNWGDDFTERYPQSRMGVEAVLRDAFEAARDYRAAQSGYDDLRRSAKLKELAPRVNYRLEALAEILEGNRHIHVHSYVQSEILALLNLAREQGFQVQTFTHILEGYKVAPEMAAAGTSASTFSDWWAYKFEVYDAIPQNACLMTEQGVNTSINSDSRNLIRKLNQEAAKSVMYCDMDREQAWRMITINPAIQLKIDHLVGSIEEGKQADLVLWNRDPLSVYARAETTWIQGRPYFERQRDLAERRAVTEERQALLQKLMAQDAPGDDDGEFLTPDDTPEWHCDSLSHMAFGKLVHLHQHHH